ncbi:MAG: membrane or secreted protein [Crocinitomicaceae bacterium]|nr:membrane or secreted protein [Crocinitomicaceae bacterium]
MKLALLTIGLLALAVAGIAIKILVKKRKICRNLCKQQPYLNDGEESCSFCGARPDEQCKKEEATV